MDSHSVRRGRCGKPSLQTKDGFQAAFSLVNAGGSCRGIHINPLGIHVPRLGVCISGTFLWKFTMIKTVSTPAENIPWLKTMSEAQSRSGREFRVLESLSLGWTVHGQYDRKNEYFDVWIPGLPGFVDSVEWSLDCYVLAKAWLEELWSG